MRERNVLSEEEWTRWLQWMKNCFKYETLGEQWEQIRSEMDQSCYPELDKQRNNRRRTMNSLDLADSCGCDSSYRMSIIINVKTIGPS